MGALKPRTAILRGAFAVVMGAGVLVTSASNSPAAPPAGFVDRAIFTGLTLPTAVEFAPDGRVFVAEKSGRVKVFDSLSDTTATTVLDLRTKVMAYRDRGLLGLELHPDFPATPELYVLYTHDAPIGGTAPHFGVVDGGADTCLSQTDCVVSSRLSVFVLSGNSAGPETVLIEDWCQQGPTHSIGTVLFGPDGKLYAGAGDGLVFNGGDFGQSGTPSNPCGDPPSGVGGRQVRPTAEGGSLRAQDFLTRTDPQGLSGSLVRVERDGTGAAGNPWSTSTDANERRIIAQGVRNPNRFTFRPGTDELWIGDVGEAGYEEINRLIDPTDSSIDNFGWPCYEGPAPFGAYQALGLNMCTSLYGAPGSVVMPYFSWSHRTEVVPGDGCGTGGSAITGIAFYEGGSYPAIYDDALFFTDVVRNCIYVMRVGAGGLPDPSTTQLFATVTGPPVELQVGPGGDLIYVDINGTIRRISYVGGVTAVAEATPAQGVAPLDVVVSGASSSDSAGAPLSFAWDLDNDGLFDDATTITAPARFETPGLHSVHLRVTAGGRSAVDTVQINVQPPGVFATIEAPTATLRWSEGTLINLRGSATVDGVPLPPESLEWLIVVHHCQSALDCHEHYLAEGTAAELSSFLAPAHSYPVFLEIRLAATALDGRVARQSVILQPATVTLNFASSPPGASLLVDGTIETTPFSRTVVRGSTVPVLATSPQTFGDQTLDFNRWSNGLAQSHNIVATVDSSLTAYFGAGSVPPDLVGSYSFDEPGGTVAVDGSGTGNNGAIKGGATRTVGRYGQALRFDGIDDQVDVADAASIDFTHAMTVEAWVRSPQWLGTDTILSKGLNSTTAVWMLQVVSGKPRLVARIGNVRRVLNGPTALPVNSWRHVAGVYDGTTLKLYVNGVLAASQAVTGQVAVSGLPLRMGVNISGVDRFSGRVDDVRLYRRALSASQIAADMLVGAGSVGAVQSPAGEDVGGIDE